MQTKYPVGTELHRVSGGPGYYLKDIARVVAVPLHFKGVAWAEEDDVVWLKYDSGPREVWSCISHWEPVNTVDAPLGGGPGGMKYDGDKPRMDLLLSGCPNALEQVSQILTFGAQKYAAHSWQTVPQGEDRYLAALLRHLTAHGKGEVNDPESGMSHLAHAACNALFILELEARKSGN
ncbi:MAG: hypothetical protein [Bacteriophage sp.]|nr:MAG: hypothetical protein [Bacteriophage sp.]